MSTKMMKGPMLSVKKYSLVDELNFSESFPCLASTCYIFGEMPVFTEIPDNEELIDSIQEEMLVVCKTAVMVS